ncbi:flagellar hook-length control protein FliK [Microbacterium sp. GXF7504]
MTIVTATDLAAPRPAGTGRPGSSAAADLFAQVVGAVAGDAEALLGDAAASPDLTGALLPEGTVAEEHRDALPDAAPGGYPTLPTPSAPAVEPALSSPLPPQTEDAPTADTPEAPASATEAAVPAVPPAPTPPVPADSADSTPPVPAVSATPDPFASVPDAEAEVSETTASRPAPVSPTPVAAAAAAAPAAPAPAAASVSAVPTPALATAPGADTARSGAEQVSTAAAPLVADTAPEPLVPVAPATPAPVGTIAPTAPAAPVAPPPAVRVPMQPQPVAEAVVSLASAPDGDHRITVTVSPERLGPVTVRATVHGGTIHIDLTAPTDAGREALRAILTDLRRDLAAAAPQASLAIADGDAPASAQGDADSGRGDTADGRAPHSRPAVAAEASPRIAAPAASVLPPSGVGLDVLA